MIAAGLVAAAALALFTDVFHRNGIVPEAQGGPHTVGPSPFPVPSASSGAAEDEDPGDGYREDRSDPNAPKTVESTRMTAIDCRFSTVDLAESGKLGNHIYQLQAKQENGEVTGSYQVRDAGEEKRFHADQSFLDKVFRLVEQHGVAQFNGHSVEVLGLPRDYGVDLDITYASGERIHVHDNQDCVLPLAFLEELHALFADAAGVTAQIPYES